MPTQLDLFPPVDTDAGGSQLAGAPAPAPAPRPQPAPLPWSDASHALQPGSGPACPAPPRLDTAIPVAPAALPPNTRWRIVATPAGQIGFMLRRSRRKSIGLVIGDDGLMVTAPHWATLAQVDEVVLAKARWIGEKLRLREARSQKLATADAGWRHDGTIPYLGRRIRLALGTETGKARFDGQPFAPQDGDCLHLPLPVQADHIRVRDAAQAWMQQQAGELFALRLRVFLDRAQRQIRQWRLSSAATRWGSCSSDGNIMLNWRLIHFERDIIDYVIAHEVAHLREMNHSSAFWREVGRILPGFEAARNALKGHAPDTLPLL